MDTNTSTDQQTTVAEVVSDVTPIKTLTEYYAQIGRMVREAMQISGESSEKVIRIGESALQEPEEPYSAHFTDDMTEREKLADAAIQVIFCHYSGAKENIHEIDDLEREIIQDPIGGVYDWLFGEQWEQWRAQHCKKDVAVQPTSSNPLMQKFLPMLNGNPTNALMALNAKGMKADKVTGDAIFRKDGSTITVRKFNEVSSHLSTATKKLLDTSIIFMTVDNYYRGGNVNPTTIIPLVDYWRRQGYPVDPQNDSPKEQARVDNLLKYLRKELRKDCKAIEKLGYDGYIIDGKNTEQEEHITYISRWKMLPGNKLKINFDIDFATCMINAFQMQYPVALLSLDNRNPNSYSIGRRIALHHSMDNNAAIGTDNTISVASLLDDAPAIPRYESLVSSGRRDWKQKIKNVLDSCLNDLIEAGMLKAWTYREPGRKIITPYTPEEAAALCWDEYIRLMVEFTYAEEPDQSARRARRAEDKAKAKAKAEKPKRKRGRPRKTAAPVE